jgi:hypothetical protein
MMTSRKGWAGGIGVVAVASLIVGVLRLGPATPSLGMAAAGGIHKIQHVVIIMQPD